MDTPQFNNQQNGPQMPPAGWPQSQVQPTGQARVQPQLPQQPAAPQPQVQPQPQAPQPVDYRETVPEPLRPGMHQVHHAFIWIKGIGSAVGIVFAMAITAFGNLMSAGLGELGAFIVFLILGLTILVTVGLVFLFRWISWKYLSYALTPTEIEVHSGWLNKKRVHVPYQRIQSVNQTATPLQRVVGICDVSVDTAGGASNESIQLQCLRTSDVEALRAELFRRKKVLLDGGSIDEWGSAMLGGVQYPSTWALASYGINPATYVQPAIPQGAVSNQSASSQVQAAQEGNALSGAADFSDHFRGVFGGEKVDTGQVSYEVRLSNKELFLAGISGSGGTMGLVVAAIAGLAGAVMDALEDVFIVHLDTAARVAASTFDVGSAVALVAVVLVVLLVMWVMSALGTMVNYGGFALRRRGTRIEVESGLLSRKFQGIDVDRIQSVEIHEAPIRRLFGYCELRVTKIDAILPGTDSRSLKNTQLGAVLHPFVKTSRVPEILRGVLPEFAEYPQATQTLPPVALRRGIVGHGLVRNFGFWSAIVLLLAYAFARLAVSPNMAGFLSGALVVLLAVCVLIMVIGAVGGLLWFRGSALGYNRDYMTMVVSGYTRRIIVTPRKKIQFATLLANPFQRRAKVASVCARTAAGIDGTTETLWDMALDQAEAWQEWVRPRKRAQHAQQA
ncbi:Bacterial membrane flanked domain [Slackia heliotrinireducens]|uniref:Predicted membrane protein n=1 Tax=Slackia heliotrinireducens (strain ATCC 29202 / DSM 20476 / NCTC 11029 / RHS 1) TaxID=471855 RepID=C7N0M1_SLAHD|nr:PH domain-containing protein [Slackia heliotrinireducens]ACV21099.1 predicted membrane protein [Slackia heliotrinireducens DSM 20476]VEH03596.1 Bacterial membrane flanked domain [Slackia heliotrinireducens]